MTELELAQAYFDAWNAQDADAIVATFCDAGTYTDPTTNGTLSGPAIGAYAKGLWDAFPDLSFEIRSLAETAANRVVVEWTMNGSNTGSFAGLPPTGKQVSLPGVDVVETASSGIESVTGYFDSRLVPEQLGMQVLVQPHSAGPFSFGYSVMAQTGKRTKPGAFSITTIWNAPEQTEEVRAFSRDTAQEMLEMDGCIGVALFRAGDRGVTVSAWEKPENTKQLMSGGTHRKAMSRFWKDLGDAAFTSVWTPDHINPLWVRCPACKKMVDHEKSGGQCACGNSLPEPPAYF